jgi:peptidoglycan LD-endopeptidase LytH
MSEGTEKVNIIPEKLARFKSPHSVIPQGACRNILLSILTGTFLLSGCKPFENNPIQSSATINPSPSMTRMATLTASPSSTLTSSITPTPAPTIIPSPTTTMVPWVYIFPVQPLDFHVSYLEGTSAHGYPAIDIFAPPGFEYVAVTAGTVEFVSFKDTWDARVDDPAARGGIAIAIIGEDGLRYYGSHLSRIADGISPGMQVAAGQVLGYIGESGNARGRGSHLHFGISRPTYPEDWKIRRGEINPFPYLNAWAAGLHVTPFYATATPKPIP